MFGLVNNALELRYFIIALNYSGKVRSRYTRFSLLSMLVCPNSIHWIPILSGFQGTFCQENQCDGYGPCLNGGTCTSTRTGARCQCPPAFAGKFCETFSCDKICLNGGTPEANPATDGGCLCECPPGTGGRRCEKTGCSSAAKCLNNGQCVLLDGQDVCNCSSAFGGLTCGYKVAENELNPCDDLPCYNGGVCQTYISPSDKSTLIGKCICPKRRAGRNCEKPNLCIDRCLNGGFCRWSDDGSSVTCACRKGFMGDRCQVKDKNERQRSASTKQIDSDEEVDSDVVKIVASLLGIILTVAAVIFVTFVVRRRRLSEAFKHRRMAESLLNGTSNEYPNQIHLRDRNDDENSRIDIATNFVNPVYETMFSPEEVEIEENSELLSAHDRCDDNIDESESADLLTEKHRGNISL